MSVSQCYDYYLWWVWPILRRINYVFLDSRCFSIFFCYLGWNLSLSPNFSKIIALVSEVLVLVAYIGKYTYGDWDLKVGINLWMRYLRPVRLMMYSICSKAKLHKIFTSSVVPIFKVCYHFFKLLSWQSVHSDTKFLFYSSKN
jgi:hypothetical protein